MIGVGVLGCGTIGPLHARAATMLDGARLVAVADQRPERAASLAEHHQVEARSSVEELLAVPGVDLVCVCTPSGTHAEIGSRIADAGRHVLLEKPIDTDLAAADAVISACATSGVTLSVISQHRFDPGLRSLHEAIGTGRLGRLHLAEGRAWWYRSQAYYDADAWRGTSALDGGALTNQGVHLVDLLLWLFGPVTKVFARAATVAHRMECEDLIVVDLAFASGMLGSLTVTTASYPGVPETISVTGPGASVTLEAGSITHWSVEGEPERAATERLASAALGSGHLAVESHRAQLQDVVDAIDRGRPPAVTGNEARAALAVVQAAYESARTGTDVGLAV